MNDITTETPPLGVGSLFGESFSLYFANFVPMSAVALLPVAIGTVINLLVVDPEAQQALVLEQDDPERIMEIYGDMAIPMIISMAAALVLWGLAAAAMTRAAYDAKMQNPVSVQASLKAGFRSLPAVVICMLVAVICFYLGFLLLFIPGLLIAAMWFVIIPAIVVERAGFGAFARSRRLTKGYRWPIIGLLTLFLIVVTMVSGLIGGMSAGIAMTSGATVYLIINTIISSIISIVVYGVGGAMSALVYARLVEIKEGTGISKLAEVFA